jgi:hypothetical protein
VADDFFGSLRAFARLTAGARRQRSVRAVLAYGGDERQTRTDATVLPWSQLCDFDWVAGG